MKKYCRRDASAKEKLEFYSAPIDGRGCITWRGSKSNFGHGEVWVNGVRHRAHRLAYEINIGPIPYGLVVCHKCDNASCVNPDHLFVGAQADNLADGRSKGRITAPNPRGEGHGLSKLLAKDIPRIRADSRPQRVIAADYGVNQSTIKNIKLGRTWRHVEG